MNDIENPRKTNLELYFLLCLCGIHIKRFIPFPFEYLQRGNPVKCFSFVGSGIYWINPTYKLVSRPITVSWMLAEDRDAWVRDKRFHYLQLASRMNITFQLVSLIPQVPWRNRRGAQVYLVHTIGLCLRLRVLSLRNPRLL